MEFFELFNTTDLLWTFFGGSEESFALWVILAIALAVYAVCLVFGGIGLSTMAKAEGIGNRFLAFLPFTNTLYAGKLVKNATAFGGRLKKPALFAMIAEIVCVAVGVFSFVLSLKLNPYYVIEYQDGIPVSAGYPDLPMNMRWMVYTVIALNVVSSILSILQLVFFVFLYLAVFRKYYARNAMLMTILCVFLPVRGFVLFAVRNNAPVDYDEYMRKRMEQYAQMRGGNFGGYNGGYGGYGGQGGYRGAPTQGNATPQDDPFGGEFGSHYEGENAQDPFGGEFDGDGNN